MALRILKKIDQTSLDTACVIVPCHTAEDAERALRLLDLGSESARFVQEFDPASEDNGNIYVHGKKMIFTGLAKADAFGKIKQAFQVLSGKLKGKKYQTHVLLLSHLKDKPDDIALLADAAVNGLLLGSYDFGLLKTHDGEENEKQVADLHVVTGSLDLAQVIHTSEAAAITQLSIYELVNLPSSHKTPDTLAQWAADSARAHQYQIEILDENALNAQGFDALLAVNRGSEYPPRLIVCQYNGTDDTETPLIAFVGKGVTFDTGGVSLKSGDAMHLMKSDMSGAAAVLGAVELIARPKAPVRVIACAPCTDNNIGTRSINPGDVIGSYSGKTIEVINTDAEGRLILADALAYVVKKYNPDVVVDLATLTGSIVRALGNFCAGMFTHSDSLADALTDAGEQTGERLWRMPLWEDYADEMKSDIADIKNLSDKPAAGSITAAKFLEHFIPDHPAWAHLDIAGVAFKANGVNKSHAATAFGVRLLYEFVLKYRKG
ncbi:MAG TPA: leucyl aminopeptidase [Saprospiraceae bacterium]|nr:leucyl aminopeptidase [Saprospiraceae bacterium]